MDRCGHPSGSVTETGRFTLVLPVRAQMRHAKYELMENRRFYGHIPECQGTWGDGATLEECRDELQSVLEDWLMVAFRFGDPLT